MILKKIGKINFSDPLIYEKNQNIFIKSKIKFDVKDQQELYKRFLIPRQNRINLNKVYFELGTSNLRITKNNKKEINIFKYKYLFTEIIKCIISCKENNITKIYVDSEESNKINNIINTLFDNFGIEASLNSNYVSD